MFKVDLVSRYQYSYQVIFSPFKYISHQTKFQTLAQRFKIIFCHVFNLVMQQAV